MKDNSFDRAILRELQGKYGKNKIISPFTLRLEAKIQNNSSTYNFSTLEDTLAPFKTEIRLNKNDVLFMYKLGFGLIAVDNTGTPADSKDAKAVIQSYPNQVVFAAVAGTFDPTDLEVFWSSKLYLTVGTTEYIPGMDTSIFRNVPQTQKSSATNASESDEDFGFVNLPTFYSLRGIDQIKFTLQLNTYNGILIQNTNANFDNRVVLRPRGFIIRGGANLDV